MAVCMSLCTTCFKLLRVAEHWTHVIKTLLEKKKERYIHIYIYTDIHIYTYIYIDVWIYVCIAAADAPWSQYGAD